MRSLEAKRAVAGAKRSGSRRSERQTFGNSRDPIFGWMEYRWPTRYERLDFWWIILSMAESVFFGTQPISGQTFGIRPTVRSELQALYSLQILANCSESWPTVRNPGQTCGLWAKRSERGWPTVWNPPKNGITTIMKYGLLTLPDDIVEHS